MEYKHGPWYIRESGKVRGPFMASVITNHILVGRLSLDAEVSTDKQQWIMLRDQISLHPTAAERDKAQRLMDERTGLDRRQRTMASSAQKKQRKQQRRLAEPASTHQRRKLRRLLLQKYQQHRHQTLFWPLTAVFLLVLILVTLAVLFPIKLPVPLADCDAPIAAQVNWSNCLKPEQDFSHENMSGANLSNTQMMASVFSHSTMTAVDLSYADLSYTVIRNADLSQATLTGAKLTSADLSYSNLSQADLSYADLRDANLSNARLDGARFDKAIWIDGQVCAPMSVGKCLLTASAP